MIKNYVQGVSVLLLLLASFQLDAQRFKGGIVGGFNLSQVDGDKLNGYNKFGLLGGIRVATVLSEKLELSTEILYSQRGARRDPHDDPASTFEKLRFTFVEVPVMLNFIDWKFHFGAGVSYSRLFTYELIDTAGEDFSDLRPLKEDAISIVLGAVYFKDEHWGFGVHWSKNVSNLEPDPNNTDLIEKWITLRTMYMF